MKKLYLLGIALLAATFAFAQANTNAISKNLSSAKYVEKVPVNKHIVSHTKDAVLLQDFTSETFPPEGWDTIQGAESVNAQHWQRYAQDYNHDDQPCAGVQYANSDGTPRNQDEWLISPEFTVPAANAILSFVYFSNPGWFVDGWSSNFGGDYADINIKISTDDGANWVTIWNEDEYSAAVGGAEGFPQMRWAPITVDLNAYAGQDVKIAFQYVGADAAFWYIDNVMVDALAPVDFALTDARVKFNSQYIDYGYNGFFSTYPRREISDNSNNKFEGVITNYGSQAVTVKMTAKVFKPSDNTTPIFSYTFDEKTIPPTTLENGVFKPSVDTITYWTAVYGTDTTYSAIEESIFMMNEMTENGTYTYEISAELVGATYANPNNRTLTYTFTTEINDECLYARDNNTPTSTYDANDPNWNNFIMFGTTYQLFNPEDALQTAEAYIVEAEEGAQFHYEFFVRAENTYQSLIRTDSYTVGADFQPGFVRLSSEDMYPLNELEEGQYIEVIAAIVMENDKALSLGVDGTVKATEYECRAMDGTQWYVITGTNASLMIRVILCIDDLVETFEANEIEMYPNPTSGIVNFNNVENATIEVFNMMGQIVSRVENANENTTIDLSAVANGNYVVRIVKNGEVATSKLNIAR